MCLTAFTDLGSRAMMRLAGELGRSFTTDEIANKFGISRRHLAKIVGDLPHAGHVGRQRGAADGCHTARAADTITLGELTLVDFSNDAEC